MSTQYCAQCKAEKRIEKSAIENGALDILFECGHRLKSIQISDTVKAYDMLGIKKAGPERFSKKHRWSYELVLGMRIGRDGKVAFVRQMVDRASNYYEKYVQQGKRVIKDLKGRLTDHQ